MKEIHSSSVLVGDAERLNEAELVKLPTNKCDLDNVNTIKCLLFTSRISAEPFTQDKAASKNSKHVRLNGRNRCILAHKTVTVQSFHPCGSYFYSLNQSRLGGALLFVIMCICLVKFGLR